MSELIRRVGPTIGPAQLPNGWPGQLCGECRMDDNEWGVKHGVDLDACRAMLAHSHYQSRCCGHWLARMAGPVPDAPEGWHDWPTCDCGSGQLVTTAFYPDRYAPVEVLSASCCMTRMLDGDLPEHRTDFPLPLLSRAWAAAWTEVDARGGFRLIHAVNRGEDPAEYMRRATAPAAPTEPEQLALF